MARIFFLFFYKRVYTKQGAWHFSNMVLTGDHGLAFHKKTLTIPYQENIPYPSPWTCWAALLLEAEELSPVPRERRDSDLY